MRLLKPTECTTGWVSRNVNWVIMLCQCRFTDLNKYITVVPSGAMGEIVGKVGQEAYGDSMYSVHNFAVNLKLFWKIKSIRKKSPLVLSSAFNFIYQSKVMGFPGGSVVKNLPANTGMQDMGLIPGSGRSLRGGNGDPLQYSCLGKSHGQRRLVGTVDGVAKKSDMTSTATSNQKGQASFWSPYIWKRKQQAAAGHQLSDSVAVTVSFVLGSSASHAPIYWACQSRVWNCTDFSHSPAIPILYLCLWVSFPHVLKPFLDNLWLILVWSFYSF